MEVDYQDALEAYAQLPAELQSPYFHPRYVLSDAGRDRSLEPIFFVHRSGGELYYHAFHLGIAPGAGLTDIQSPYGYGGPLASTHDPAFLSAAVQAYASWCRGAGCWPSSSVFTPCSPTGDIIPERSGRCARPSGSTWKRATRARLQQPGTHRHP